MPQSQESFQAGYAAFEPSLPQYSASALPPAYAAPQVTGPEEGAKGDRFLDQAAGKVRDARSMRSSAYAHADRTRTRACSFLDQAAGTVGGAGMRLRPPMRQRVPRPLHAGGCMQCLPAAQLPFR